MSFARMNDHFETGVTLICSIVPVSFSLTIFRAGKKLHMSIITIAKSAGIMNSL